MFLLPTSYIATSTVHETASLGDEGNSTYCQSSGAHNIKVPLHDEIFLSERLLNFYFTVFNGVQLYLNVFKHI